MLWGLWEAIDVSLMGALIVCKKHVEFNFSLYI